MPAKNTTPTVRSGGGSTFRASDPSAAMDKLKSALSDVLRAPKAKVDEEMKKDADARANSKSRDGNSCG